MADFGTNEEPNLNAFDAELKKYLERYQLRMGPDISLKLDGPMHLTPDKPNTARTTVTVNHKNVKLGTLYAILFTPGDGTGDANTYKQEELKVPKRLQFADKPERVFPRKKDCALEVFFPFFSVINREVNPYCVSLEELTVENGKIVKLFELGFNPGDVRYRLEYGGTMVSETQAQFTVGYSVAGVRYGDPHAIYQNRDLDVMQLVGFLSLEKDSSLCSYFGKGSIGRVIKLANCGWVETVKDGKP